MKLKHTCRKTLKNILKIELFFVLFCFLIFYHLCIFIIFGCKLHLAYVEISGAGMTYGDVVHLTYITSYVILIRKPVYLFYRQKV